MPILILLVALMVFNTPNDYYQSNTSPGPLTIKFEPIYVPGPKEVVGTMKCTSNGLKLTTTELMEKKYWAINFPDRDVTIDGITYHHADCLIVKD